MTTGKKKESKSDWGFTWKTTYLDYAAILCLSSTQTAAWDNNSVERRYQTNIVLTRVQYVKNPSEQQA